MSTINAVVQSATPGEIVSLFRFDTTVVGGSVYYFVQAAIEADNVRFGGVVYTPVDVEFTDLQTNSAGSLPTPHLKLSNTNEAFQGLVNTYGDMLGCVLQRVRTFRRFLDGQEEADPSAFFGPDIFRIERKVNENPIFIEWELSASIDQEGKLLPGRQVLRDVCPLRYRMYDPGTSDFDYSKATCPYAGGGFYDRVGQPTSKDKDACGRKLSDCRKRFGAENAIPYGGFPGVARIRV